MRRRLALPALAVLAALLTWAALDLPDPSAPPGAAARKSTTIAVHERHATNTVSVITFDLRGFDTLGEELILFSAAVGTTVLLRAHRGERRRRSTGEDPLPGPVQVIGAWLVAPVLVLGGYVVAHGQLTPGGGFQGGVVLAAGLLLAFAVARRPRVRPLEVAEAVGAGAFAIVALGGLVFGAAAVANFLPLGTLGDLWSAGTIPILNVAVGLEVTGAITLIVVELAEQLAEQG